MLKFMSCFKLPIVFCALALALPQHPCFAQTSGQSSGQQASAGDQQIPPAVAKKLEAMEARIEQLEAELKARPAETPLSAKASVPLSYASPAASSSSVAAPATAVVAPAQGEQTAEQSPTAAGGKVAPFSDADWTWLNGNPAHKRYILGHEILYPGDPIRHGLRL
jgi:hypothetical protein